MSTYKGSMIVSGLDKTISYAVRSNFAKIDVSRIISFGYVTDSADDANTDFLGLSS